MVKICVVIKIEYNGSFQTELFFLFCIKNLVEVKGDLLKYLGYVKGAHYAIPLFEFLLTPSVLYVLSFAL